jgi:hypothetical protein
LPPVFRAYKTGPKPSAPSEQEVKMDDKHIKRCRRGADRHLFKLSPDHKLRLKWDNAHTETLIDFYDRDKNPNSSAPTLDQFIAAVKSDPEFKRKTTKIVGTPMMETDHRQLTGTSSDGLLGPGQCGHFDDVKTKVILVDEVRYLPIGTARVFALSDPWSGIIAGAHDTNMDGFLHYVLDLERLALTGRPTPATTFAAALDGEAGRELRRLVDLDVRRDYGAFFTGSILADRLVARASASERFHDPSCGAADLLLAAARHLPIGKTLRATVALWSRRLSGFELHTEFVRAAKARLVLMARSRGFFTEVLPADYLSKIFPKIVVCDALAAKMQLDRRVVIVMNPPFNAQPAPADCRWWGNGHVNVAAVFVARYLEWAAAGTRVLAILPDVLRSGSYYAPWRVHVAAHSSNLTVQSWGLFDANADVDVFMLDVTKLGPTQRAASWPRRRSLQNPLGNTFEVSVGAVVPHRHKNQGIIRRFLDARSAPSGGIVCRVKKRRRFEGTVVKPPFVAVKRTSRPGDKFRAAPTVVTGTQPVAVENHLIVCRPKDGTLIACKTLAKVLQSARVNRSLNRTIRCRHLTVGAVRTIDLRR